MQLNRDVTTLKQLLRILPLGPGRWSSSELLQSYRTAKVMYSAVVQGYGHVDVEVSAEKITHVVGYDFGSADAIATCEVLLRFTAGGVEWLVWCVDRQYTVSQSFNAPIKLTLFALPPSPGIMEPEVLVLSSREPSVYSPRAYNPEQDGHQDHIRKLIAQYHLMAEILPWKAT